MIIREACEKDIPELLRILSIVLEVHAAIRPDYFVSGHQKYDAKELVDIINDDSKRIYVAMEDDDKMLGYAFCELKEVEPKPFVVPFKYLYLDDLCVDECVKGKNVASAIFEHVKLKAKELGCRDITLNVWEGNDRARAFYDKMGMKPLKTYMELRL